MEKFFKKMAFLLWKIEGNMLKYHKEAVVIFKDFASRNINIKLATFKEKNNGN